MLQYLKPFHCTNCSSMFSNRDTNRVQNISRVPFIMPCRHSICEHCLKTSIKHKMLPCSICKTSIDITEEDAQSKFHPDLHALGILNVNLKHSVPSTKIKMVPSTNLQRNLNKESFNRTEMICGNCKVNQAQWQCDKCERNFCNVCFDEVHAQLRKHEGKKLFAEVYNTMVQNGCPDHNNKDIEFYCELDNKLTCSFCMLVGSHVGHEVKTLVDKNKSCAEDLKNVLTEITEVHRRMKYTDYLLTEAIPTQKVDISKYIKIVHDHFHDLHASLQIRETELISQLEDISQQNTQPLEKMKLEISAYHKDLLAVKKDAEKVIENPYLAVSAPALLKKLEEFKVMPCYLVGIADNMDDSLNIDFTIEEEFDKKIKNLGKINFTLHPKFALMSKNELPDNYTYEMPERFATHDFDAKSVTTTHESFSEDSLSVKSQNSVAVGIQNSLKCREFTRKKLEEIYASHIQSPSSFWVQKLSERRKLKDMSDSINRWCKSNDAKKCLVETVDKGDLYLVQYSVDKRWYRGRVKRILAPEEPFDTKVTDQSPKSSTEILKPLASMVEVIYIDFGNTEIVPMSKMRNIQARFLNLPGLSKECSLIGIQPADGVNWSLEALNCFKKFISNKPLLMQIYEERNNILYVDLSEKPDNSIACDTPVSVRDALVFLEHAVFPAGITSPGKRSRNEQQFLPPEQLRANSNISAVVSHVTSPSHIYVQQMSTAPYLSTLIFDMSDAYNNEHATMFHGIYAPRVNMICAAQFTLDQQWYRAEVKSLPGGAKVEVQYVDFGNSEVINYKRLRKIFDKFNRLNIQAIPCKLADIAPKGNDWTAECIQWLTNTVSKKQLILKSLGMIPGENKADVVLYYNDDEFDICVNALLVEEGFAKSTGPTSACSARVRKQTPEVKKEAYRISHPLITVPDKKPVFTENQPKISKKSYPSLVKSYPTTDGKTMDVIVSHVLTPAVFYIRIASDLEKKLTNLMIEMQKVYENCHYEVPECVLGKSYVVFSRSLKKWCRANVTSKLADDIFEVFLVDFGSTEQAAKKDVQKLLENFTQDESFALRCHLEGIIPAGGSSEWSQVACEAFQQLVSPHEKLLVTTKGELENGSLGVELYFEELMRGGALEPTKIEFRSITKALVNRGLALKIRPKVTKQLPEKSSEVITQLPMSSEKAISDEGRNESLLNPFSTELTLQKPIDCQESQESVKIMTLEKCEEKDDTIIANESLCGIVNDVVQDNEINDKAPTFQWLPRVIPTESKFKGVITNINEDGCFQLHTLPEGGAMLNMISKALKFKFGSATPQQPKEPLAIGEACIAKFCVDYQWYRAEVVSHCPGKVKVNFVDYGNNEIVLLTDVITTLIMEKIPRQCVECKIHGSDLEYEGNNEVINFLHAQLVDTTVEVEQLGKPDELGRITCNIITPCGMSVLELVESMKFATRPPVEAPCPPAKVMHEPRSMCRTFKKASELQEGDIFPVCVTQINSPNIVYLQRMKISNPKSDLEKKHNEEHEMFLQLIEDLQEKAESFPPVTDPMPGMACCAKYSYDNNWYRCEVTNLGNDEVDVLYVDYGNSETLPVNNLRSPEDFFIKFPVQVHFCKIHGVNSSQDDWDKTKSFLVQKFMGENEVFAKVVVPGKISEVDLLLKDEEGHFTLTCENLIKRSSL